MPLLQSIGEPIGDCSILPTFLLCRFARNKVVVALSGEGGDELFAGYDPFRALRLAEFYSKLVPGIIHPAIRFLASRLPHSNKNMSWDFKLQRTLRGLSYPNHLWNPVWLGALEPTDIEALFLEATDPEMLYSEAISLWDSNSNLDIVDKTLEFYTCMYLQDNILVKADRASMQNSLEIRLPFLDNNVVDFVRCLPHQMKYCNGVTKYILKKSLQGILPKQIIERKKKGFGIPISSWLKDYNPPSLGNDIRWDRDWLKRQWYEHKKGKQDNRHLLFSHLALSTIMFDVTIGSSE